MASRYLLFADQRYYPEGGWHDFVAAFDSLEDALKLGEATLVNLQYRMTGYHVVDRERLKIVACGGDHVGYRIEV